MWFGSIPPRNKKTTVPTLGPTLLVKFPRVGRAREIERSLWLADAIFQIWIATLAVRRLRFLCKFYGDHFIQKSLKWSVSCSRLHWVLFSFPSPSSDERKLDKSWVWVWMRVGEGKVLRDTGWRDGNILTIKSYMSIRFTAKINPSILKKINGIWIFPWSKLGDCFCLQKSIQKETRIAGGRRRRISLRGDPNLEWSISQSQIVLYWGALKNKIFWELGKLRRKFQSRRKLFDTRDSEDGKLF